MNDVAKKPIPVVEGFPCLEPESHLRDLLTRARRKYTYPVLAVSDYLSRRWLEDQNNPYLDEIHSIARRIGQPGAYMLNMSYEWACTSMIGDSDQGGPRLVRTLDWPLDGLGRCVIVARAQAAAGVYFTVTWPGYVGVLTAMAPERFAVSINQAPLPRKLGLFPVDWLVQKSHLRRSRNLPPHHLLRKVCDECTDYQQALEMLSSTPLALPVFFSLVGAHPGQGAIIERLQNTCFIHESPTAIANHFIGHDIRGHSRGRESEARHQAGMTLIREDGMTGMGDDFSWLVPPVLNPDTRLSVDCLPMQGTLRVQGWESSGAVTEVLHIGR